MGLLTRRRKNGMRRGTVPLKPRSGAGSAEVKNRAKGAG